MNEDQLGTQLRFPNRALQWPTTSTPALFQGIWLHDCYWSNHFAITSFQTWFKPNNESKMPCTSQLPKLAQLWKASSAIHRLNFVRHAPGRGGISASEPATSLHSAFLLLQINCQRKSLYVGLWSQTSSYNAGSQPTAARHVKRVHSHRQNTSVHACWLMMDGRLCQLTSVTRRTWQVAGWSHAQATEQAFFFSLAEII